MKYAKNCKPNSKDTRKEDSKAKKGKGIDARGTCRTIKNLNSICWLH